MSTQIERITQITKFANAIQLDPITIEQVEAVVRAAATNLDIRIALEQSIEFERERTYDNIEFELGQLGRKSQ